MKLVRLMKMCVNETYNKVRIGKHLSDAFPIQNGLKQGDATGYGLDDPRVRVRVTVGSRIFFSPCCLGPTQPPIQWVPRPFPRG
jgi:hypothetical protein